LKRNDWKENVNSCESRLKKNIERQIKNLKRCENSMSELDWQLWKKWNDERKKKRKRRSNGLLDR